MDLVAVFDAVLHSIWLVPVLVVLIAVDGPFPVLPSETLLMSAAAAAFGVGDAYEVGGLFVAAVLGSVLGDLLVFALGRSSHRVLHRADAGCALSRWVRAKMLHRPLVALVGARFVPGGRLVSTAAAGRVGLSMRSFLPGSLASSAAWGVYMLVVGMLLGPMVGGNPLLSLAAGVVMAVVTAGAFAVVQRVRARRSAAAAELPAAPVLAPARPALVSP